MKFQFSVRELMFLVFVVGLGFAGLSTGGWIASLCILFLTTIAVALAIVAFVGHGQLRSFAIGFVITMLVYVAAHTFVGSSELDPYGKLPTSKLWLPVFEAIVRREYINLNTGQVVPNYNPSKNQGSFGGGIGSMAGQFNGMGGGTGGGSPAPVGLRETPERATFMTLAHALLATALAYCGGKFAVWVSGRSAKSTPASEQKDEREPHTA